MAATGNTNSPRRRRPKPLEVPTGSSSPLSKKRKRRKEEPPFWWLVVQVGTTLACLCVVFLLSYRYFVGEDNTVVGIENYDDDDNVVLDTESKPDKVEEGETEVEFVEEETYPPLPVWNLTEQSTLDAFAIAEQFSSSSNDELFWTAAAGLRQRFSDLYGGENAGRAILERGTSVFGDNNNNITTALVATACRVQRARTEHRPFRMTFGGYSVTAGRGNYQQQSFPMVLEKLLHTVFYLLQVELVVKNAAIGGCPSFPYGWCMKQFWGPNPDVVSWDFSMNEAGGDPVGLEAYLRHVLTLERQPKLIVKDTHTANKRRDLLQHYQPWLQDPILVHTDPAARPFLDRPEEHRPTGFQEWRKFGTPPGAPGQALHHPAVKEHAFVAWILVMHFLGALELVAADRDGTYHLQCNSSSKTTAKDTLPPPLVAGESGKADSETKPWHSILFGEPTGDNNEWTMNPVHCRTSFEPIVSGDLSTIIGSGSVGEDLDVMLPKSKMFYNRGWVLDLSEGEKKAKRNLDRFGGLGFLESKKAYYGLPTAQTLRFLVPYQATANDTTTRPVVGDLAKDWFKSVVWCEVNEKREASACNTEKDVDFVVGGVNITDHPIMDAAGTLFMGKKLCTYLRVPDEARLVDRKTMLQASTDSEVQHFLFPKDPKNDDNLVGLSVDATVMNQHIINREESCSVSHVVWEQVRMS
jgi:hypothetical protein